MNRVVSEKTFDDVSQQFCQLARPDTINV